LRHSLRQLRPAARHAAWPGRDSVSGVFLANPVKATAAASRSNIGIFKTFMKSLSTYSSASKHPLLGKRAIVTGAGMGGLIAARVLADFFDEVIIVDRDHLADEKNPRPGIPQGRHPHGLLGGGTQALEALFPGFTIDLAAAGAVQVDSGSESLWETPNQADFPRIHLDWTTYCMSRPLLELTLRRRVERISNLRIRAGHKVLNIVPDSTGTAAIGIRYQTTAGAVGVLESDFIVDASGNGFLTMEFLRKTGRHLPKETTIGVHIRYSSALFERCHIRDAYRLVITPPAAPDNHRAGLLLPAENNTYQVALKGIKHDVPPLDPDEFVSYAKQLPTLTIYHALKNAKRVSEITPFSFPESRWRHFNTVPDFPRGLLPIGDAISRFNPVYGQGMSVAAQEAKLLSDLLQETREDSFDSSVSTFLTRVEAIIADPWTMSAIPDFAYRETTGERPADLEERLNFQKALNRIATRDVEIYRLLMQVRHLMKPRSMLYDPAIVERVKAEVAAPSGCPIAAGRP
jgi:2-polyprenyl-6-methoxyphenol hydroxylase-like FAD-dependent oxidoreductase